MAKFHKNPLYHPDDKDILDFLMSRSVGANTLAPYLRKRRTFISSGVDADMIREYVSLLPFDWKQSCSLIDIIELPERSLKESNLVIELSCNEETIESSIDDVKKIRSEREREVYQLSKKPNNGYVLTVDYVDSDYSQTRLIQKKEKKMEIDIEISNEGNIKIRYESNPRAEAIIETLQGKLQEALPKGEELKSFKISLSSVPSKERRIKFFMDLMNEMEGFSLVNITQIDVDRMPMDEDDSNTYDEDENESQIVEIESIKKLMMKGDNLNSSPLYQDILKGGYFISGTRWISELNNGDGSQIEFEASFKDVDKGDGFQYTIWGKYTIDKDGILSKKREKLPKSSEHEFKRILEDSAQKALDSACAKE